MKDIIIDLEAEKKEILKRYRALLRACKPALQRGDKQTIRKAFDMALECHKDMRRKSGEPYIYHPIAVAQIAAEEIGLGTTSIVCADRKSTRLNSSHVRISYAVFCLK